MISDEKRKSIIEHPFIKKIIHELNLNLEQIESGLEIFEKIIEEQQDIENLEFKTIVEIYDEKNVIGVAIPNKQLVNQFKIRKFQILNEISEINNNVKFAHPKKSENNKDLKSNIFYWNHILFSNDSNDKRPLLAAWLKEYYFNSKENKYTRGLYIYGPFGTGKTFFLYALTNYLIDKEKTVSFLNIADFYEFATRNLENNDYLQKLKNVDVLIIDDIGNEKQNNWFLFSILYPIIEYRNMNEKTTCFSSIFSINDLQKYWLKNRELDRVKIERLIEKIKTLTYSIEMTGKNLREK